jgi:rubrerythrin
MMACMTHFCRSCGHEWSNNKPGGSCPACGSRDVSHTFDEYPEEEYDDDGELDEADWRDD